MQCFHLPRAFNIIVISISNETACKCGKDGGISMKVFLLIAENAGDVIIFNCNRGIEGFWMKKFRRNFKSSEEILKQNFRNFLHFPPIFFPPTPSIFPPREITNLSTLVTSAEIKSVIN
jgi:hypothetical protein